MNTNVYITKRIRGKPAKTNRLYVSVVNLLRTLNNLQVYTGNLYWISRKSADLCT